MDITLLETSPHLTFYKERGHRMNGGINYSSSIKRPCLSIIASSESLLGCAFAVSTQVVVLTRTVLSKSMARYVGAVWGFAGFFVAILGTMAASILFLSKSFLKTERWCLWIFEDLFLLVLMEGMFSSWPTRKTPDPNRIIHVGTVL